MTKEYSDFLAHYGIKGQKHGVRRFQNEDGSLTPEGRNRYGVGEFKDFKRLNKDAKRDAKEYVRAKAYYGEGAGIRRRHIGELVADRSRDRDYKEAFDKYVQEQSAQKAVSAAKRKRRFEDVKSKALPTTLAVVGAAAAAYPILKSTGMTTKMAKWGRTAVSAIGKTASRIKMKASNVRFNSKIRVVK